MRLVNRPETFYRPVPRHGSACRQHRFSLSTVFYIGFLCGVAVGALVVTVLVMAQ